MLTLNPQKLITIDDSNFQAYLPPPVVDGEQKGMGLVPRDFNSCPVGYLMYAKPFDLPVMAVSEIEDRIQFQEREQSSLWHLRMKANNGSPIPSLDQNGQGYCWAYSSTSAMMLARASANMPYVRLSAHKVGCFVKGYRDQGGWNAQSVQHIAEQGVPSIQFWPEKSMSRANDTPQMRENAQLHKYTEWMDLDDGGANLKLQVATCLLLNIPLAMDFNWWEHSVCGIRLISWNPFKVLIWNSWRDSWSDQGCGVLEGNKAIPNGSIACRVPTPSIA